MQLHYQSIIGWGVKAIEYDKHISQIVDKNRFKLSYLITKLFIKREVILWNYNLSFLILVISFLSKVYMDVFFIFIACGISFSIHNKACDKTYFCQQISCKICSEFGFQLYIYKNSYWREQKPLTFCTYYQTFQNCMDYGKYHLFYHFQQESFNQSYTFLNFKSIQFLAGSVELLCVLNWIWYAYSNPKYELNIM